MALFSAPGQSAANGLDRTGPAWSDGSRGGAEYSLRPLGDVALASAARLQWPLLCAMARCGDGAAAGASSVRDPNGICRCQPCIVGTERILCILKLDRFHRVSQLPATALEPQLRHRSPGRRA